MVKILNNLEPGFYSQSTVSPSLFLNPTTQQIVALIGTGKNYKLIYEEITRGTGNFDILTYPIKNIVRIPKEAGTNYTDYSVAYIGLDEITNFSGLNGKELKIYVNDELKTITFSGVTQLVDILAQINGSLNNYPYNIVAFDAGNKLGIRGLNYSYVLKIGNGSANSVLNFIDNSYANAVYWFSSGPAINSKYTVYYNTPKVENDYKIKFFTSLEALINEYKDANDDLDKYSLPFGGYAVFGGGASVVACVQLNFNLYPDKYTAIEQALKELEPYHISIIVPLDPINSESDKISSKITLYLTHVTKMSSLEYRRERVCILSVDEKNGKMSMSDWEALMAGFNVPAASGLQPKRIMMIHPGSAYITYGGKDYHFDGTYNASVLAGLMCSNLYDEATSMTRKVLPTISAFFKIPETEYSRVEKNLLTSYGVTVLEMKDGIPLVRRSVTTDTSNIVNQEPSIVRSFDRVSRELRNALESRFVGQKIRSNTLASIQVATIEMLNRFIANEIIAGYRNLQVKQNELEPRQVDVKFEASPIYTLLWGLIDITITL